MSPPWRILACPWPASLRAWAWSRDIRPPCRARISSDAPSRRGCGRRRGCGGSARRRRSTAVRASASGNRWCRRSSRRRRSQQHDRAAISHVPALERAARSSGTGSRSRRAGRGSGAAVRAPAAARRRRPAGGLGGARRRRTVSSMTAARRIDRARRQHRGPGDDGRADDADVGFLDAQPHRGDAGQAIADLRPEMELQRALLRSTWAGSSHASVRRQPSSARCESGPCWRWIEMRQPVRRGVEIGDAQDGVARLGLGMDGGADRHRARLGGHGAQDGAQPLVLLGA